VNDEPASLRHMTDDELRRVLATSPDTPIAERAQRELQLRRADREALKRSRRGFIDLVAIACWIVLWVGSAISGRELGKSWVGPQGEQGYLAVTGLMALALAPLTLAVGVACAVFLLWRRREVFLFILSAIPSGLAITWWPFVFPSW